VCGFFCLGTGENVKSHIKSKPSPVAAALVPSLPITRFEDTIFIPLPVELWRATPGGKCGCQFCKADGSPGYWDTLALSAKRGKERNDRTYTVHHPGLHSPDIRKKKAALAAESHSYNDLAGNGYCFECGLEEGHPEAKHVGLPKAT
jgi:hypothetical protein